MEEILVRFLVVDSIAIFFAVLITFYSVRALGTIRRMKLRTTLMLPTIYAGILLLVAYAPAIAYSFTDDDTSMWIHHILMLAPFFILMVGIRAYDKALKISA